MFESIRLCCNEHVLTIFDFLLYSDVIRYIEEDHEQSYLWYCIEKHSYDLMSYMASLNLKRLADILTDQGAMAFIQYYIKVEKQNGRRSQCEFDSIALDASMPVPPTMNITGGQRKIA